MEESRVRIVSLRRLKTTTEEKKGKGQMANEPIRDPAEDHLLTPKKSALVIVDYQPAQVNSIISMDQQKLIDNIVRRALNKERGQSH